jgi:uncharacterized repeat protein (TIGR04138 family)
VKSSKKYRELLEKYDKYSEEAYDFIYKALDYTVDYKERKNKNVSGEELLEGIMKLGIEEYGPIAGTVFNKWRVTKTDDFGDIVFNLAEFDLLYLREKDSRKDFRDVYDFESMFDVVPVFPDGNDWENVRYIGRDIYRKKYLPEYVERNKKLDFG